MNVPFWSTDPSILFKQNVIIQIFPVPGMSLNEKLNATSRLIILFSISGFLLTYNYNFLFFGFFALIIIFSIYNKNSIYKIENFDTNKINVVSDKKDLKSSYVTNPVTLESVLKQNYYPTTKRNPLGNVLLTDIMDNPEKKPAPPSFNVDVYEDIIRASKKTVQSLNPDIKNTNKQLFGDLAQDFEFDWSMWNFFSMPNTRVTNDQGAYAEYLYGYMPSCKDGNAFACVQDNLRYILI